MINLSSLIRGARCLRRNSCIFGRNFRQNKFNIRTGIIKQQLEIATPLSLLRKLSTTANESDFSETQLDKVTYERICAETLDALCDYFEELIENARNLSGSDVSYSDGVLTVNLGSQHGTYVINRQSPNKQIWLSSPRSGPKRYDFVASSAGKNGKWIYRHNGETMHELLQRELQEILRDQKVDFFLLPFGK